MCAPGHACTRARRRPAKRSELPCPCQMMVRKARAMASEATTIVEFDSRFVRCCKVVMSQAASRAAPFFPVSCSGHRKHSLPAPSGTSPHTSSSLSLSLSPRDDGSAAWHACVCLVVGDEKKRWDGLGRGGAGRRRLPCRPNAHAMHCYAISSKSSR